MAWFLDHIILRGLICGFIETINDAIIHERLTQTSVQHYDVFKPRS